MKKLKDIAAAGIINVKKFISASSCVSPAILKRITSSGDVRKNEAIPPRQEPIAAIIIKRKANYVRSVLAVKPIALKMPMSVRSLIKDLLHIILITTAENVMEIA